MGPRKDEGTIMHFSPSKPLLSQAGPDSRQGASRWAGRAARMLGRAGNAVWQGLEDLGQARANRELLSLANNYAITNPELASLLREGISCDATPPEGASSKSSQSHAPLKGTTGTGS